MSEKYSKKRRIGNVGEGVAVEFLQNKGFVIITRNYLKPWGEIDIIATKKGTVRFIEVKSVSREPAEGISREINDYRPEEMVNASKLRKVSRTAEMYMNDKRDTRDYQIDVVTVFLDMKNRRAQCKLYEQVL